jgi:hypothetical protein
MRTFKLYTLSTTAALLLAGVAHADDSALFGQGGYAGQSTQRTVETPRGVVSNATPHWTSRIGTGTVTTAEKSSGVKAQQGAAHYPAPYWASLIGTGTAAKL